MPWEKLQAFVLSTLDYGDSDRIVSLFTLEHGRIRAFARGARKSRKRFGPALEPFARIEAQVRLKEGLSSVQQADIITIYPGIRADLERIAHALYAGELVDAIAAEGQALPRLFRLHSAYLERLETEVAAEADRRFYEINLLNILGYRPSLESCARCDSPFGETGALMQNDGEPVCRSCSSGGQQIFSATLAMLSSWLRTGSFGQTAVSREVLLQAGRMLDGAMGSHLGKRLKSLDFIQQICIYETSLKMN